MIKSENWVRREFIAGLLQVKEESVSAMMSRNGLSLAKVEDCIAFILREHRMVKRTFLQSILGNIEKVLWKEIID